MKINKIKNVNPLRGLGIQDLDVCQEFGLPDYLAGNPKLNQSMADLMYEKNIKSLQQYENMSLNDAKREAGRMRKKALSIY